jgi:argonaute-like protein implicated in RNA metabolism and viral defense
VNHYYFSECKANEKASDIAIHLYTVPLSNPHEKYSYAHSIAYELRKLNSYITVAAHGQYIASFEEICHWGDRRYIQHEHRPIQCSLSMERTILEKLLKKELENRCQSGYKMDNDLFRLANEQSMHVSEISIHPAIYISFSVEENGDIFVGFDYQHRFEYRKTLQDFINTDPSLLKEGMEVVDPFNRRAYYYTFVEIADYTAGQKSPFLQQSVIDYYLEKNELWKLKGVHEKTPVVHVKSRDGHLLPYLPHLLKLTCSYEQLPPSMTKKVNRLIKLSPHEKMSKLYTETFHLLGQQQVLTFQKENVRAVNLGYDVNELDSPIMVFGQGYKTNEIYRGLKQSGVYEPSSVAISFFVDPELNYDLQKRKEVGYFVKKLESMSEALGVKLNISDQPRQLYGQLPKDFFKQDNLSYHLKSITDQFRGTVVVVIGTEENIDRAYVTIKKEFGGKEDLMTQFVGFTSSLVTENNIFHYYNILLGIYAKAGIQSWILSSPMHSECFIGLDVSHEQGRHASGIVQIIGREGKIIKQKSVATAESGETIANSTMEEIVNESIYSYEQTYGAKPRHITFHRDGICREDLDFLQAYLRSFQIPFDFVEIIKKPRRRMAVYSNRKWMTKQGVYYSKGNTAYLCATDPKEAVGMAQPIKIVQKTNGLSIHEIVSDIYKLSFMHIHSMLKTRLPITIHYADLSSTFHNRGLIHPRSQHERALPFV